MSEASGEQTEVSLIMSIIVVQFYLTCITITVTVCDCDQIATFIVGRVLRQDQGSSRTSHFVDLNRTQKNHRQINPNNMYKYM